MRRSGLAHSHPAAGPRRSGLPAPLAIVAAVVVALATLAGACSPATPSSSSAPSASAGASAGDGTAVPKPTAWPTTVVEAAIALGAADGDFTTIAKDVIAAVNSEEPARILKVMNDTIQFLTENQKNIPKMQAYPETKSVGDRLEPAYAQMLEGATEVRAGLTAGNSSAVETGLTTFFAGNDAYVKVSSDLGDLAEQALFMKRQLLR